MMTNFSIITITKDNNSDLLITKSSIDTLLNKGAKWIVINGGKKIDFTTTKNIKIYNEFDTGIYNALNKGIQKVTTKFMMFLHSGDEIIRENSDQIERILYDLERKKIDLSLNSTLIQYRSFQRDYKSDNWKKYMLYFGVQPPHLPIIYNSLILKENPFSEKNKIVSDFLQLEKIFFNNKISTIKHNVMLVKMKGGGKTTSGIKSYVAVTKEFYKVKGLFKSILFFISRYLFKLYLMK